MAAFQGCSETTERLSADLDIQSIDACMHERAEQGHITPLLLAPICGMCRSRSSKESLIQEIIKTLGHHAGAGNANRYIIAAEASEAAMIAPAIMLQVIHRSSANSHA